MLVINNVGTEKLVKIQEIFFKKKELKTTNQFACTGEQQKNRVDEETMERVDDGVNGIRHLPIHSLGYWFGHFRSFIRSRTNMKLEKRAEWVTIGSVQRKPTATKV